MGNSADIATLVSTYISHWQQADVDGLMSMYSERMTYHDMPSGVVVEYNDLHSHLSHTFVIEAGQRLELNDSVYIDDRSAFIYWTQVLETPGREQGIRINGVELIVFEEGKIVGVHEFYDYQGTGVESLPVGESGPSDDQMSKLGLSEENCGSVASEISELFETARPYLNPDLSLNLMAESLGYTRNQVSFVLNHIMSTTFYDLVNRARVEHVIETMKQSGQTYSIVEMAVAAGFSSTSGFYNAFRKVTGMTPIAYQKSENGR